MKGTRPQFKLSPDGLHVNVQGTLLANMGTALGVLGELPRVTTEGDKVEVYGKGQPEIYINNKKVRDVSELRELKSTDILSVEIISNPGAQYDATVESVIRIKTIKRLADGFSFSSQTQVNYNSLLDGYETVKATWRSGRLETFANIDYNNHANKQDIGLTTTENVDFTFTYLAVCSENQSLNRTEQLQKFTRSLTRTGMKLSRFLAESTSDIVRKTNFLIMKRKIKLRPLMKSGRKEQSLQVATVLP